MLLLILIDLILFHTTSLFSFYNDDYVFYYELHRFQLTNEQNDYHIAITDQVTLNIYKNTENYDNDTSYLYKQPDLTPEELDKIDSSSPPQSYIPPMIIVVDYNQKYYDNNDTNTQNNNNRNYTEEYMLLNNPTNEIVINYNNDEEWNEILLNSQLLNNGRRRLWHGWWHWYWHHHYRWWPHLHTHRGRFRLFRAGGWRWRWHGPPRSNYWSCWWHCRHAYGSIASVNSWHEHWTVHHGCRALNYHGTHSWHWRGWRSNGVWSCYIGLRRPFHKWDDGRKVTFTHWAPGEPNNWGHHWGHREDCTEVYNWYHSWWNDLNCHNGRACACQEPRGIMYEKFIGVVALRNYWSANQYCLDHYGTTLATVHTQGDNDAVLHLCHQTASSGHHWQHPGCYIGLRRPFNKWDDGTRSARYTNWVPGEPNDAGNHEDCTELLRANHYYGHGNQRFKPGRWNDIACWASRGFVCNAQTALQAMSKGTRDNLISKRMYYHKFRWEMYKERARRNKISKELWAKLQKQKEEYMAQRLAEHERMRDELRQHIFEKELGGYFNKGTLKRRRRLFYKKTSNEIRRKIELKLEISKKKKNSKMQNKEINNKKINQRSNYKQRLRNLERNSEDLFKIYNEDYYNVLYDDNDKSNISNSNWTKSDGGIQNNINIPLPLKCTLINNNNNQFYEICVNHNMVDIKKFMKINQKKDDQNQNQNKFLRLPRNREVNIMEYIEFEQHKYQYIINLNDNDNDNDSFSKIGLMKKKIHPKVYYTSIHEKDYDSNSNHVRQCWMDTDDDDDVKWKEFETCLEINENNNDVILYVTNKNNNYYFDGIYNFHNNEEFDEIIDNYRDTKYESIEKCKNVFIAKICVLKNKENNNYKIRIFKPSAEEEIVRG